RGHDPRPPRPPLGLAGVAPPLFRRPESRGGRRRRARHPPRRRAGGRPPLQRRRLHRPRSHPRGRGERAAGHPLLARGCGAARPDAHPLPPPARGARSGGRRSARHRSHRGSPTALARSWPGRLLRARPRSPGRGRGGRRQRLGHGWGGGTCGPLLHGARGGELGRDPLRGARRGGHARARRSPRGDGGSGARLRPAFRNGILELGPHPRPPRTAGGDRPPRLHRMLGLAGSRPRRLGRAALQPGLSESEKRRHPGLPPPLSRPGDGVPAENGDMMAKAAQKIHLLGVGGTGMGAFAYLLKQAGHVVTGSDQNLYPPMSEMLKEWGIEVLTPYAPENLDRVRPDLVVVGNVIRRENPEATAVRERGLPQVSFPQALGELFLEDRHAIVVAGTHGKTTTTSMVAHLLHVAGRDPSFLVGGVLRNFGTSARLGSGEDFVVEGDEYDTAYFDKGPKFLHYRPRTLIFTSCEFDHADIYRDPAHYESAFERLMELL